MSATMLMIRRVALIEGRVTFEAVKLPDGELGAIIASLCAMLDIATVGQVNRIKRTPQLASALVQYSIATPTGPRLMNILLSYALPLWAAGLQATRLSPEKQELAELIKNQAMTAIQNAFTTHSIASEQPAVESTMLIPSDSFGVMQEGLQAIQTGISQLQNGLISLQQTQATVLARLAALEGMPRQYSGTGLPPEKVAHLVVMVRALRAKKGLDINETLGKLAAYFHVAHFSDIPNSAWPDVLTLLETLMG